MGRIETWKDGELIETVLTDGTIEEVRAETARRLRSAFGARDDFHLMIKVNDAQSRANQILDKQVGLGLSLSQEDAEMATYLRGQIARYWEIKAAGEALEAMEPIPADLDDDQYWP